MGYYYLNYVVELTKITKYKQTILSNKIILGINKMQKVLY